MADLSPPELDDFGGWQAPQFARRAAFIRWLTIGAVAVLLFVTFVVFRWRDFADYSVDWQIMLKGGTWLTSGAVGTALLRRHSVRSIGAPLAAGLLLFLFFALSTVWSPTPEYTLAAAGCTVAVFLFAIGVGSRLSEDDLLISTWIATSGLVGSSLVLYATGSGSGSGAT